MVKLQMLKSLEISHKQLYKIPGSITKYHINHYNSMVENYFIILYFTAPSLPENLAIDIFDEKIYKKGFEVNWFWPSMRDDNLNVYITYTSPDGQQRNVSEKGIKSFKELTNLKSGTFYELCLYIKQFDALSDNCRSFNVTTRK